MENVNDIFMENGKCDLLKTACPTVDVIYNLHVFYIFLLYCVFYIHIKKLKNTLWFITFASE